jgi:hypothetical protein
VVGTFAVGAPPDAQVAYVAGATARKLLGSAGTQGIQLRLSDRELVPQVSAAIRPLVGESTKLRDWRSSQGSLFDCDQNGEDHGRDITDLRHSGCGI